MKYFVVDVFTEEHFHGNQAGVCVLDQWLEDDVMQKIAFENNLAETAFLVKNGKYYDLRWFTPEAEIDLCGHATLGSSYVLMNHIDNSMQQVEFHTMSGVLTVSRNNDMYIMNFPSRKPQLCKIPDILEQAIGSKVLETYIARDMIVVVENAKTVAGLKPDLNLLKQIPNVLGFCITAKGDDCDFVSRFFIPDAVISEDPVTGSSHTSLIPYWSERLSKKTFFAKQLSQRGGCLYCKDLGDRVEISGKAVTHLIGDILL